jgi:hypothetical protein
VPFLRACGRLGRRDQIAGALGLLSLGVILVLQSAFVPQDKTVVLAKQVAMSSSPSGVGIEVVLALENGEHFTRVYACPSHATSIAGTVFHQYRLKGYTGAWMGYYTAIPRSIQRVLNVAPVPCAVTYYDTEWGSASVPSRINTEATVLRAMADAASASSSGLAYRGFAGLDLLPSSGSVTQIEYDRSIAGIVAHTVFAVCAVHWLRIGYKVGIARQRVRDGMCAACGYSLKGVVLPQCPECGSGIEVMRER